MKWWQNNRMRMIQNNLRDIDGDMDVDALVAELQAFCCNTVMVGASGITAFFRGSLPCDVPSPYLQGDKLGEIVEKCHAAGIRVIARFDFSKTHVSLEEQHPEWYYRDAQGCHVTYNDTVQTCVNGDYQQVCALDMISEVLDRYAVDGIFFNMFGYTTRDYSGVYHGICQCEGCQRRFREFSGMELPTAETEGDPVFERYKEFKQFTVADLLEKIRRLVDSKGRDIAVCTYSTDHTDLVRDESNSAVDRPLPFWLYSASENCQTIRDGYPGQISCNVAINAVDIFYRFQGVSPHLTQMRLFQNMAAGSGLDWCIIGRFEGYPDRLGCEAAKEVFRFHARHEKYYGQLRSIARVALLKPMKKQGDQHAYRGAYRILKEEHVLFDILPVDVLEKEPHRAQRYELLIAPDVMDMGPAALQALRETPARLLVTGRFLHHHSGGWAVRQAMFDLTEEAPAPAKRSWYVSTEPKEVFTHFPQRDWVFVDEPLVYWLASPSARALLPMVAPANYGPPERCFGHVKTEHPALVISIDGQRAAFAFAPDRLYDRLGYEDHKQLVLDALALLGCSSPVKLQGPECVEMFADALPDGSLLVQSINHSGFNGSSFFAPRPVQGLKAELPFTPSRIIELTSDGERELPAASLLTWDMHGLYQAFVIFP